jgi:D-amino-acid oxidase
VTEPSSVPLSARELDDYQVSKVTVIGAGVSGLTTAITLANAGHDVSIVARDYLSGTTSWVAAAIWHLFRVGIDHRVELWASSTLDRLRGLAGDPASGVTLVRGVECVRQGTPEASDLLSGRTGALWAHLVPYLPISRDALLAQLPIDYPGETLVGGYEIEVPIADMSLYLPYLDLQVQALSITKTTATLASIDQARSLCWAEYYVNCTGLGSRALFSDQSLEAIKGQVIRVSKDSRITQYIADDASPRGMTYILPRGSDIVLGGSADEDGQDEEVDAALSVSILSRCIALVPALRDTSVLESMAGLRPYRPMVRLEIDAEAPDVVHNYGHGGSGVSLSWGCAEEVATLVGGA